MHILFLGNGGSPNTINWVRYYAGALGHQITLLSFDPVHRPIPAVEILDRSSASKTKYLSKIPFLRGLLRELRPDLLLAYRLTSYGFTAACSGFHPFAVAAMGRDLLFSPGAVVQYMAASYSVRRADLIHSWGENMTQRLIQLGADPGRIMTLPRGVDTSLFYPEGVRPKGPVRVVTTRSLDPYYRMDVIIRAIAALPSGLQPFEHRIIGDGPDRPNLDRLVRDLGLGKAVTFLGAIDTVDLAREVRAADIYVSAVPTDGTSSSLLEAIACGVFPIVVDNEANRIWVRHGENGYLFPAGDVESLGRWLAAGISDPDLRARAAARNVEDIRKRGSWTTNMKIMAERQIDLCRGVKYSLGGR